MYERNFFCSLCAVAGRAVSMFAIAQALLWVRYFYYCQLLMIDMKCSELKLQFLDELMGLIG